jgi:asparagine synthase (glutamine-hydrolysing)
MCGIFFYYGNEYKLKNLLKYFKLLSHRGPDDLIINKITDYAYMGFHRLAINGLNKDGNQPMLYNGIYLICNGEIYNYKFLATEYNIKLTTGSDCEIILPLYEKYGIKGLLELISGEFAFVIYDSNNNSVYVARDPLGIRSLYWGQNDNGSFFVASEMKAIPSEIEVVEQFPSGHYCKMNSFLTEYYSFDYAITENIPRHIWLKQIKECLEFVCEERLMSERSIGCILSGGLDSTLVTAIVCNKLRTIKPDIEINTYTIGLSGATDLKYATLAAEYLKTNHHNFIVSEEDLLNNIEDTIYQIESYDVTTVRASVGNYLISKKIKELGKDTVLFCGDVSDEIFGSYRGFQKAENPSDFFYENVKMLKMIRYFDVLRSDKSISGASLEARVPFGDVKFVNLIMSIPPEFKMFNDIIMEKQILRDAFKGILPDELLYRRKEAFSDGLSKVERSWFEIIQEFTNTKITDEEFNAMKGLYHINQPYDKESLYYRIIFDKFYPGRDKTIPYYWKHPFTTEIDPSARKLDNY